MECGFKGRRVEVGSPVENCCSNLGRNDGILWLEKRTDLRDSWEVVVRT